MDLSLLEALEKEELLFKKFSFVGTGNIQVAGNLKTGYVANINRPASGSGPVGACCVGEDCSTTSPAGCSLMGGDYQGDGTPCSPNPCITCPDITMVCDSISASCTKCGFGPFDGSPGKYLRLDATWDEHQTPSCRISDPTQTCIAELVESGSGSITFSMDEDCHCSVSITGSTTQTITSCNGDVTTTSFGNPGVPPSPTTISATYEEELLDDSGGGDDCSDWTHHRLRTCTLSNEYTTDLLVTNTEAVLTAYDDDFDDSCSASRDLSDDESSYSVQRFKPKFTIPDSPDSNLVICYNEHFVPDGGGDPVDTPKTVTISVGEVEVTGDEVLEPGENGETTITDITCCPA